MRCEFCVAAVDEYVQLVTTVGYYRLWLVKARSMTAGIMAVATERGDKTPSPPHVGCCAIASLADRCLHVSVIKVDQNWNEVAKSFLVRSGYRTHIYVKFPPAKSSFMHISLHYLDSL